MQLHKPIVMSLIACCWALPNPSMARTEAGFADPVTVELTGGSVKPNGSADKPPQNDEGGIAGAPCQITCQAPNLIPENEPCGANTVNSGCDGPAPPNFQILRCHEGYCASSWAFNNTQDTDWYQSIVNDSNADGTEYVCYNLTSEFPAVLQIYSGTCGGLTLITQGETSNCTTTTICACLPAPGVYLVKVYPGTIAGGPILSGMPCASPFRDYIIEFKACQGVCPTSTGACCYQIPGTSTFLCTVTTQQDCVGNLNGVFQGTGTTCNPDPCNIPTGACCHPTAAGTFACTITTQTDCVNNLGGIYYGDNTTCPSTPCDQSGACCYVDPLQPGTQCVITTAALCQAVYGGIYQGNGSVCVPTPCDVVGACCYINPALPGTQCIVTTAQDCHNIYNGIYQGNGTSCTPDPCPDTGACCYQQFVPPISFCVITTQQDCIATYNGVYQGDGTVCNPDPCVPTGACCYHVQGTPGYICTITTQQDCINNLGGYYYGNNTVCNPDTCLIGACCHQVPGTPGYICSITTQSDCLNNLNGIYMGNGTFCNADTCLVGACCHQNPTVPGSQCTVTTQANCVNVLQGTYQGNGTVCGATTCQSCLPPPPGMVAWWTLDETVGPIANDSAFNNDGKYMPNLATGPTPLPGMVGNSLGFDGVNDFVQVPPSPSLNFNCGAFSIDAWIRPVTLGGGIVSKWGPPLGYDFSIDASGYLVLLTESSTLRCFAVSTSPVVAGVWSHVAVTVSAAPGRIVSFYINGALAGTSGAGCDCLGNGAPVLIGSSPFNGLWHGKLDEIEMFNRVITQQEIQDIMNYGKCKQHCEGQWETPFCFNTSTVTATVFVCNDSGAAQNFFLSFVGIPGIPNTLCNGPLLTGFTVVGPNPVTVPAGQCLPVQVQIARPAGLTTAMHSCYTMTITNTATNQSTSCSGSVIRTSNWCGIVADCCFEALPVGVATTMTVQVTNTADPDGTLSYLIAVMNPEMLPDTDAVRLNGLPPGTPVKGTLSVAVGGTVDVPVEVEFVKHVPFGMFDALFMGDEDNSGNLGQVMLSVGMYSAPPTITCLGDVTGNNTVNIDDLLAVINAWGPCANPNNCPADIAPPPNGNGTVNIDDLLAVINHWGACP